MVHVPRLAAIPDQTAAEITRCALTGLQASAALFYWIENGAQMSDVSLAGISNQFYQRYAAEMEEIDPSNVRRMTASGDKFTQLRRVGHPMPAEAELYTQSLRRYDVSDVIDLMFWADGVPVAGIGVLKRVGDPVACDATLTTAGALQRYIEFNLQRHQRIAQARRRQRLLQHYGLTTREADVSQLVLSGLTNGEIATALCIRVPTVKSHLMQIFSKIGCGNRTRLSAILSGDI